MNSGKNYWKNSQLNYIIIGEINHSACINEIIFDLLKLICIFIKYSQRSEFKFKI